MMVFDGKKFAKQIEEKLAKKVAELKKRGITPKLISIVVGDNPASHLYLKKKREAAQRVGIEFEKVEFKEGVEPAEIIRCIKEKNIDKNVDGLMVQLPLPEKFKIENSKLKILGSIDPRKDVDCLTPENLGLVMMGQPRFLPATVRAVVEILFRALRSPAEILVSASDSLAKCRSLLNNINGARNVKPHKIWQAPSALIGKNIVIVGASNIVGKPLAMHLKNCGATVTLCDEDTKNLANYTRQAEILVSATGVPNLIKKEMVKKGAMVIDVGSPKGDVDFEEVKKVASLITPVPGGVGPMTVVCLLENV